MDETMSEDAMPDAVPDNEAVYDEQVDPLMRRVLEICRAYKLPMLAYFQYKANEDGASAFGEVGHLYPAADIRMLVASKGFDVMDATAVMGAIKLSLAIKADYENTSGVSDEKEKEA